MIFAYYIPSPDFLEIGFAESEYEIIEKMKLRCNVVYGNPEIVGRYAAGVIYYFPEGTEKTMLNWKELAEKIQHHVRFNGEWKEISSETYEKYADKFIHEVTNE